VSIFVIRGKSIGTNTIGGKSTAINSSPIACPPSSVLC